jgi:hypothetical protein
MVGDDTKGNEQELDLSSNAGERKKKEDAELKEPKRFEGSMGVIFVP